MALVLSCHLNWVRSWGGSWLLYKYAVNTEYMSFKYSSQEVMYRKYKYWWCDGKSGAVKSLHVYIIQIEKNLKKWKSQVYSQIINKGIDLEKSLTLKEIYIMWYNPIIKYLWVSEWAKLA